MRMTEIEALRQLLRETERLTKHAQILTSNGASGWDLGNSNQHLPFCIAAVAVALNRLTELKHNEFRSIVKNEIARLEGKNVAGRMAEK